MNNPTYDQYLKAAHAMQTGVAMKRDIDPTETQPKHLRVGVNSAMVDTATLVSLLISKGLITKEEWMAAVTMAMETEVKLYETELEKLIGKPIKLL